LGETTEEDGSVNNILDALGGGQRTSSVAGLSSIGGGSVSLYLEPASSACGIVSLAHPPPKTLNNDINGINNHPDPGIHNEDDDDEVSMIRELSILSTPSNKRSPVIGLVTMTVLDGDSGNSGSSGLGSASNSNASNCNTSSPISHHHHINHHSIPIMHQHQLQHHNNQQQVEVEDYEHVYCQLDPYFVSEIITHVIILLL
jgi:hypothetical protein